MIRYVAGFLYTPERTHVVLIQKNRPLWMRGRWNGVGGKLEPGESWDECMMREFREETGVLIPPSEWQHAVTIYNEHFECRFFRAFSAQVAEVDTVEDEVVGVHPLSGVHALHTTNNVQWLVPLLASRGLQFPLSIRDDLPEG